MRFGADYYPEHWPEDRWEEDARLMREAGFDTVRLAEFAWSKMEPWEGHFEFDWLLRALDTLHVHGIDAVIGTPTAAPPAWLCANKPHILRVNEGRGQVTFGNRQHYCVNQPDYEQATDHIVGAMAQALAGHEAVIAWQPDNEFGPMCYCEVCRRRFHAWLERRYGTLKALNEAWGTIFWSQTYSDWRQIPLPWTTSGPPNPSLALEYRRFMSDSFAAYQQRQIDIIRAHSSKPVTHNFMGLWPEVLDYTKLTSQLDFTSWDNYPATAFGVNEAASVSACHDLTRGYLRRNFWVMEQLSGPCGWGELGPAPKPGRLREWTYHAIGRGADAIVYFRWRPCRSGTEQYWHGILNHDGSTNRRYEEIKSACAELRRFEELLAGTSVNADVAFINDYDSRFAFQYQRGNPAFSYPGLMLSLYRPFYARNIAVDILSSVDDLSRYRLVVAPALFVIKPEQAEALRHYVRDGGTLVMTFRSAVKNETGLIVDEPLPGMLQDVFGAVVSEYHSPRIDEVNSVRGVLGAVSSITGEAGTWLDLMDLRGAEAVAEYGEGFMPGAVAVTRNSFGSGAAYYVGTQCSQDFANALMYMIADGAGVEPGIETPEGVDASVRAGEHGSLLFLTNHSPESRSVAVSSEWAASAVFGEPVVGPVQLPPYGVDVLVNR